MSDSKLVLIVEDELLNAKAIDFILKKNGYNTLTASNGKEGLETAKKFHPDLILLDIIMPVMDGVTVVKELNKDPWGSLVPIIILSNLNENDEIKKSIMMGSYEYLLKSDYSLDQLMEKIKKVIG